MDYNHWEQIEQQQQYTVFPKRSILTDHTNTNLLDNVRKRTHFLGTENHISPPASPDPFYKRPKQDPAPSPANKNNSSLLSLLKNPFSIFHHWNPIRNRTPHRDQPTAPLNRPHIPMQDPLHPPGTSCRVTFGPTIKPWAYSNLKRDQDDLSSTLSTPHRDSLSRSVFQPQTQSNKTVFKNDLFARKQNQSYLDLLHSKSIPIGNLTSTPRPLSFPAPPCDPLLLDTKDISSARLSSFLDPPPDPKSVTLSSTRFPRTRPLETTPRFKPPSSRGTPRYPLPKYDKQLASQVTKYHGYAVYYNAISSAHKLSLPYLRLLQQWS